MGASVREGMQLVRSAVAILAGLAAVVALSAGTDKALTVLGTFPPMATTAMLIAATVYRSAYAVVVGYIAARLAPEQPMLHAIILGMIGFAVALFGCILMWHVGNHWYPIALVITALPCTWLGGKIAARA
jgi:hypothetical protein